MDHNSQKKAKALTDKSIATADRGDRPVTFVNFTAKNAMSARYVLERADWAGAAALPGARKMPPLRRQKTRPGSSLRTSATPTISTHS